MRILVLGGTTEATRLAGRLAVRGDIWACLSLAGRTREPAPQALRTRIGGFGGVPGLIDYLNDEAIDLLVDATHPFAAQISRNALQAGRAVGIPVLRYTRAPWTAVAGDRWTTVGSLEQAALAIGEAPRRVLLTVGRLGLSAFDAAPQHHYLIRTIDPPEGVTLPDHKLILERGPFETDGEIRLMQREAVDVVVTKNSGGLATYGKIAAARSLGLPVILVEPPQDGNLPVFHDLDLLMGAVDAHDAVLVAERGV
ncbi:cobalt-precorrin-6A reductase [Oryzibacter oryziterrae]|uniref:cobalt-precorrin-6A reductase n=1 Tax=Oryzibacter oryziterrae TaxID=2766474 RepID=UPI001EFFA64E|nr:cobalt-precorrin-6A reductase [Oryzibacter oryziterrae]